MDVLLSLECRIEREVLHLRYVFTNQGSVPILAYDGAPGQPIGAPWPEGKSQVYASVTGDVLAIKRVNPPLLPGVMMETAFIPALSETMPGERREVRFALVEPVTERSQYTPDFTGASYRERQVHTLQLQLGYFAKTEAMQLVPYSSNAKAYRLKGTHAPQLLATANVAQIVRIKERVDGGFQRV